MDWWPELVNRWWPADQRLSPSDDVHRWLQSKHDVAARLQPKTIGELGVRAGYSAYAMLAAAPSATYLGIDIDDPGIGSEPGALEHANVVLAGYNFLVIVADSHDIERLPPLDLLHVDGDHSHDGCTADLELARRSGVQWALVDDYDTGRVVRGAVDAFAARYGLSIEHIADGFRGSALLCPT